MTTNKAVREFYFWLMNSGHKKTARLYRGVLENLPNVDLTEVTPMMLEGLARDWNGIAPATSNQRRSALRSFFNWCVQNDWIAKSPARLLKDLPLSQKPTPYLDENEIARFREAIKGTGRDELLFSAYLMTGCRLGELLRLNVGDVRDKDVLTITGKGGRTRQIFLNEYLTGLVKNMVADRADAEPLFASALDGRRLSTTRVRTLLKEYCEKAKVKRISPHGLRHSFLSLLYSRTKDILICQQAAGHSQVRTTQRYCHVAQSQVQSAVTGLYQ